jgi:NAD(P)-dependent dehydrogenase (short-subunit alcohol dehydrogenase family)
MPSQHVIATSNAAQQLVNKQVLVVGGTSGIGEYTAKRLAAMKANVSIAGRNEEAAKIILERLKELHPTGSHTFHKVDMSLVSEAQKFAKQYMENHSLLHYLVISCGFLSMAGRTETKEGIDRKMATHYYGRWTLINELMPLLEKTAKESEVRVMSILAATHGGPINPKDLDLKTTFSVKNAAMAAPTYNDLMVEVIHVIRKIIE